MTTSLIPERPLLISPTLAATIGLEEAVLLHVISELLLACPSQYRQQRRWGEIGMETLAKALPFWEPIDIRRIQRSLQDLGVLLVEPAQANPQAQLFAINQPDSHSPPEAAAPAPPKPRPSPFANGGGAATYIPHNWQPDAELFKRCLQRGIPREFAEQEVPSFVTYWRERQKSEYSWSNKFLNWTVASWERQRSTQGVKESESEMTPDWQPSIEAMDILEHADISRAFIEDAIPEFVLYWRERGMLNSAWNSKFIAHVRRQWIRYTHALENDSTPRPLPPDFAPSSACFEVLAMANIDADFAQGQVKEFALYWQDRREVHGSWNTKFLQHVKYQWAQQMQPAHQRPLLDKLSDRSWAD